MRYSSNAALVNNLMFIKPSWYSDPYGEQACRPYGIAYSRIITVSLKNKKQVKLCKRARINYLLLLLLLLLMKTRIHSSRMRTTRFNGRLTGVSASGSKGCLPLSGCLPLGRGCLPYPLGHTPLDTPLNPLSPNLTMTDLILPDTG